MVERMSITKSKSFSVGSGSNSALVNNLINKHPQKFKSKSGETLEFTELQYKTENFISRPSKSSMAIQFHDIIKMTGQRRGELTPIMAFSMESNTAFDGMKNVGRVVLVNELGERVLDTLVKPQLEMEACAVKQGVKSQMFQFADEFGPDIKLVRERVTQLIQGRTLIGYHLPQKITDFGLPEILAQMGNGNQDSDSDLEDFKQDKEAPKSFQTCYDIAKIFNTCQTQQQQPLQVLCEKYINLCFKKSRSRSATTFFGYSEAKIAMALFKQWQVLTGKLQTPSNPLSQNSITESSLIISQFVKENSADMMTSQQAVTITGADLKKLVQEFTKQAIQEEVQGMLSHFQKQAHNIHVGQF